MPRGDAYNDYLVEKGRLIILQEIAREFNGHLREDMIQRVLDAAYLSRSVEWVRTQLRKLEELGAVTLTEHGGMLIAGITRTGRDHVERRAALDGVAWPQDRV